MGLYEDVHSWITKKITEFKLNVRGVIHVGAHLGEEAPFYDAIGIFRQIWIEPVPPIYAKLVEQLPKRPDVKAFQAACAEAPGRKKMVISESWEAQTHSLAKLKRQVELHPWHKQVDEVEVEVVRLDDLLEKNQVNVKDYNLLVVDTQGAELETLKGAEKTLPHMDCVVAELGTVELYEGMALEDEVNAWLAARGFYPRGGHWFGPRVGYKSAYGDVIYLRTPADGK